MFIMLRVISKSPGKWNFTFFYELFNALIVWSNSPFFGMVVDMSGHDNCQWVENLIDFLDTFLEAIDIGPHSYVIHMSESRWFKARADCWIISSGIHLYPMRSVVLENTSLCDVWELCAEVSQMMNSILDSWDSSNDNW